MARPRTPSNVLELRGSFKKDPQRNRKNEPKTVGDVGSYSVGPTDQKEIWNELIAACPKNVLTGSDRIALEIAVEYMRQFRLDPVGCTAERVKTLINLLARFGMTPADRAKLSIEDKSKEEKDPWANLAAQ